VSFYFLKKKKEEKEKSRGYCVFVCQLTLGFLYVHDLFLSSLGVFILFFILVSALCVNGIF
jgi:hypothetical protein